MSTVQIRLGDMFDGPSDLIVLPCSAGGAVTDFVMQKLSLFRIPSPSMALRLGDVQLQPFEGGESIAQYVAFAASVGIFESSLDAIGKIGGQLGTFTKETAGIRRVATPLLGAGAGGLDPGQALAALSGQFHKTASDDAVLTVSVLDERLFKRLSKDVSKSANRPQLRETEKRSQEQEAPLRVFVSYTHGPDDHQKWVRDFATFLRSNGIDARLDAWHLRAGMDLPQFMANELAQADRVIVVSDEHYVEKADGRVGGVGWETMLIQGDLYRLPPDSRKYLAVIRSKRVDDGVPAYMKTKFVIHWPGSTADKANREKILRELYDRIAVPPLGPKPVFVD